jgi:hypothetical protein
MNLNHRKSFLIIIFIFISIFIFQNNVYAIAARPSKKYPDQAKAFYGWMIKSNISYLSSIDINKITSKFITEDEIRRYCKLKMRNFIKDYKFVDTKPKHHNYNFSGFNISLYKYNDKMEIYYGLFYFNMIPYPSFKKCGKSYVYTDSIAGSDNQIRNTIKEQIDIVIELFAEDYYYMKDLK